MTTCPFDEYRQLEGTSYSDLKGSGGRPFVPTAKMQLGTKVHNYLLEPAYYDHTDIGIVKPLAMRVKQTIGDALWPLLQPEISVQAELLCDGFVMPYKGRGDMVIPERLVLDLKVTEMPISFGIKRFGWDRQINGYKIGFGVNIGMIIAVHPKTRAVTVETIRPDQGWWEQQIRQRGYQIF